MIAVPCSPIAPESEDPVAGRSAAGESAARGSTPPDARRADVHPVGVAALDDLRVAGDDLDARRRAAAAIASTSARSSSAGSPSSSTSERLSASGRAPPIARSLTVPLTASSPIEPPGKRSGLTTKLSVVIASPRRRRSHLRRRRRAAASAPPPKAGTKRPSISALRRLAAGAVGHRDAARRGTSARLRARGLDDRRAPAARARSRSASGGHHHTPPARARSGR